jgi:hypothetical protein
MSYNFKDMIQKIYEKKKTYDDMEDVTEILHEHFEHLKGMHVDMYNTTMHKLEDILYEISLEDATMKVKSFKPYGQKWSYEDVKKYLETKGITTQYVEYYLTMNMAYNNFYKLAEMVGKADSADFYFEFAKNFILDVNAHSHKIARYFMD